MSAIGDDAIIAGYGIVPDTGEDGKVKYGAREINRTRDYIARTKLIVDALPQNTSDYQTAVGIRYGSGVPSNSTGNNGDIYFRYG